MREEDETTDCRELRKKKLHNLFQVLLYVLSTPCVVYSNLYLLRLVITLVIEHERAHASTHERYTNNRYAILLTYMLPIADM